MKKIIFGIMVLFLMSITGCGGMPTKPILSQSGARIINADFKMMEGCQFLGDVHGNTDYGSLDASVAIERAKIVGREQAVSMGATHIVWTDVAGGPWPRAHANGKAYLCK